MLLASLRTAKWSYLADRISKYLGLHCARIARIIASKTNANECASLFIQCNPWSVQWGPSNFFHPRKVSRTLSRGTRRRFDHTSSHQPHRPHRLICLPMSGPSRLRLLAPLTAPGRKFLRDVEGRQTVSAVLLKIGCVLSAPPAPLES